MQVLSIDSPMFLPLHKEPLTPQTQRQDTNISLLIIKYILIYLVYNIQLSVI